MPVSYLLVSDIFTTNIADAQLNHYTNKIHTPKNVALTSKSYFREGYGEKATFLEVTSQRIVDIFSGNRFVS